MTGAEKRASVLWAATKISDSDSLFDIIRIIETELVNQATSKSPDNIAYAARLLGLHRTTLIMKKKILARDAKPEVQIEGV